MDIHVLAEKLPAIRRWIEGILARSRPFTKRVDSLAFPRLSSFYSLETMAYQLQAQFESNDPPFSVEPRVNRALQPILPTLLGGLRT